MEEDIVFLEKMIKEYKTFGDLYNLDYEDTDRIYQAIENLIDRNKELEEKHRKVLNKLDEDIKEEMGYVKWLSEDTKKIHPSQKTIISKSNYAEQIQELLGDDNK